jgi:hypothetical protein
MTHHLKQDEHSGLEGTGGSDTGEGETRPGAARRHLATVVGIIVGVGLFVLLVVLHLTGVLGPGAH